ADVQVRSGSQRGYLAENLVDEGVGDVLGHTQRAEADVRAGVERGSDPVTVELGVARQRGVHVPRHVDLRHDRDVPGGGVRDDLPVVVLRVVPARVAADGGAAPIAGEVGPTVDHDAPALVVGQVQVQVVHLVQRDLIEVALHRGDREEVPRHVE